MAVPLLAVALSACGGASNSELAMGLAVCGTPTLAAPIFTTSCSGLAGLNLARCEAGTPPVCLSGQQLTTKPRCACTGTGTNLYAATAAVGLCGRNIDQTRESLESKLCGVETTIEQGKPADACTKAQEYESAVWGQQNTAVPNAKINGADADLLRGAAQAIEAAIQASGTPCAPITPVVL